MQTTDTYRTVKRKPAADENGKDDFCGCPCHMTHTPPENIAVGGMRKEISNSPAAMSTTSFCRCGGGTVPRWGKFWKELLR